MSKSPELGLLAESVLALAAGEFGWDLTRLAAAADGLNILGPRLHLRTLASVCRSPATALELAEAAGSVDASRFHRLRRLAAASFIVARGRYMIVNTEALKDKARYFGILQLSAAYKNLWEFGAMQDDEDRGSASDDPTTDQIARALSALSDVSRRRVFELIVIRPSRVVDLTRAVAVSRPAVSHHVKSLKDAGLVRLEAEGLLHANVHVLPVLRAYFDRLWIEATLGDNWLLERSKTVASMLEG